MKKSLKRMMAYIYMPLFFSFIGIGIVYIAAYPLIRTVTSAASLFILDKEPTFEETGTIIETPVNIEENDSDTVNLSDITLPNSHDVIGSISCERIGLLCDFYYGDDSYCLNRGAGMYRGSQIPGRGKPTLVAGHSNTVFNVFQDIQVDDEIIIDMYYGEFHYKVTDIQIYQKDNCVFDLEKNEEQLMMYTCYPIGILTPVDHRLFVYAEKISGPTIVDN